jgi:oligopeptide/dipeptide ABC transporter ATP-binding protein
MSEHLLEARNLTKHFPVKSGLLRRQTLGFVKAVDAIDFAIDAEETFGLVGESGCGKTTVANLILLLQTPTAGEILFWRTSLARLAADELQAYRRAVQAVFQDPYGALNPRMRVGDIVGEPLHSYGYGRRDRQTRVHEVLRAVGLPEGSEGKFPHEFSGGQRQRISIARALTLEPALIVLDEPVSSLDVSIRTQILNLLKDIQQEKGVSYLLISHDMASVEYMCHRIGVMYLGRLVEVGSAEDVCSRPMHPYSATLVAAATPPGRMPPWHIPIIGEVPNPLNAPQGCAFHPRCPYAMPVCRQVTPALAEVEPQRWVACHLYPDMIHHIDKASLSTSGSLGAAPSPVYGDSRLVDTQS